MNHTIKQLDFFYPDAINWMWSYCLPLGKFTDSRGNNYDLGIHLENKERNNFSVSAAIVNGNTPGDYYSGDLINRPKNESDNEILKLQDEKYEETIRRCKILGILK